MTDKELATKLLEIAEALLNTVTKKVCQFCGSVNTFKAPKGKTGTYHCLDCGRNFYMKMRSSKEGKKDEQIDAANPVLIVVKKFAMAAIESLSFKDIEDDEEIVKMLEQGMSWNEIWAEFDESIAILKRAVGNAP